MAGDTDVPGKGSGRFYHIDCAAGDIAPYVLTCGDPARAETIAGFLEDAALRGKHREFQVITGLYKGIPTSVMATGIGPSATAIALVEIAQCMPSATFIRLGTCGALQEHIAPGDLVITERALRDENTTHYYASSDLEARAHPLVLESLLEAARELGIPHHSGLTCTTSDFYAGQGRAVPGFPTREPDKVEKMRKAGALNFEMEMSVYLTLARCSSYPLRAGGMCAVLTNRLQGSFASPDLLAEYETRLIKTGLRGLEILYRRDNGRS
ncbi:MAG: nucleoside phosphorylase [Deltaproteobacteria bacterium]